MELAIFGAEPKFKNKLYVGRPNLPQPNAFFQRVQMAFADRWLTNDGPLVQTFEDRIQHILKVKHCIAVANCTLGLQMLIRAFNIDGEVIMPSFTFIATPHSALWEGMRVVFADIDPATHLVDPKDVEAKMSDQTVAICGVHVWGQACAVEELQRIASFHNVRLYYDAAHAFYCAGPDKMLGNYGDAEVFSFHATKFLHTFEGGCITTNDDDLAEHLRMLRNFGFPGGHQPPVCLGINAKLNEVSAAMGLANLDSLKDFVDWNYTNYLHYELGLKSIAGVRLLGYGSPFAHNYQYVVIEFANEHLNADNLRDILWAENVLARRYFSPPCHLLPPYNGEVGDLPVTESVSSKALCLPTGTTVTKNDVGIICDIIRHVVEYAEEISPRLDARNT